MKRIGMLALAMSLVATAAAADTTDAPKAPVAAAGETKQVSASSVEAAKKRGESTVFNVQVSGSTESAPKTVEPTLVLGKFPTVGTTKLEASSVAGSQVEVKAPTADAVKATETAPPAVVRVIAGLRPKFQACGAKPKGAVVMNVSVTASGQLDVQAPETAMLDEKETACVVRVIQSGKVRGARGTVSALQIPL